MRTRKARESELIASGSRSDEETTGDDDDHKKSTTNDAVTMSSSRSPQKQPSNPLVESLVAGDRQGVGGILCNDTSGLCLSSDGAIESANSGVYTNLVRLAAQLQQGEATDAAPLITIETDSAAVIVKEYHGHAVALKVPTTSLSEAANGQDTNTDAT